MLVVHLVPLGAISDETIEETARGLTVHAHATVVVENGLPLPPETQSTIRGRYRAERILTFLGTLDLGSGKRMGLTEVDIVTTKESNENWGILGLGAIDGTS